MTNCGIDATGSSNSGAISGGTDYGFSNNDYQQEPKWKKGLMDLGVFGTAERYPDINPNSLKGASVFG